MQRKSFKWLGLAAMAGFGLTNTALASQTVWDVGTAELRFDADEFLFSIADDGANASGNVQVTPIPAAELAIMPIANGFKVDFGDRMQVYDDTHGLTDNGVAGLGSIDLKFNFAPKAGYRISGYNVAFTGRYSFQGNAYSSAYLNLSGDVRSVDDLFGNHGFGVGGAPANQFTASILAVTQVEAYEQIVGYTTEWVSVYIGTEYSDPNCQEDGCPLQDVYERMQVETPVYDWYDIPGYATIAIDSLSLSANLEPVPLPAAAGLFAAGLPFLLVRRRGV